MTRKMIIDVVHTDDTENTDGGPQADSLGEREFSGINRKLKNIYPQMSLMDTVGGPQADGGVERKLFTHCQLKEVFIKLKQVSGINRELKEMGPQTDEVRKEVSINYE